MQALLLPKQPIKKISLRNPGVNVVQYVKALALILVRKVNLLSFFLNYGNKRL